MTIADKLTDLSDYINKFTEIETKVIQQKGIYYLEDVRTGNKWTYEYLVSHTKLQKKDVIYLLDGMTYSKGCVNCANCVRCSRCRDCKDLQDAKNKVGLVDLLRSQK